MANNLLSSSDTNEDSLVKPFMNPEIETSIVIVNWNGKHFLGPCLESVRQVQYPKEKLEVIIVDNNSSDGSVSFINEHYPEMKVIRNDRNDGFARGSNIGISHARGDYIVLLNNDTTVSPSWLAQLISCIDLSKKIGIVIPKTLFLGDPTVINSAGMTFQRIGSWPVTHRGICEKDAGQYDTQEIVEGFSGVSVLLHRAVLRDVGLFDERFYMYFEDTDLAWRSYERGWKTFYNPKAVVYHVGSGSSKEGSPFFWFYNTRNRLMFVTKNSSLFLLLLNYASFVKRSLEHIYNFLISIVRGKNRKVSLAYILVDVRAFFSYLRYLPSLLIDRLFTRRNKRYIPIL